MNFKKIAIVVGLLLVGGLLARKVSFVSGLFDKVGL